MVGSEVLRLDEASHFGEDSLGGSQLLVLGSQRTRGVLFPTPLPFYKPVTGWYQSL